MSIALVYSVNSTEVFEGNWRMSEVYEEESYVHIKEVGYENVSIWTVFSA
jgi:hypothetical protein